MFAHVCPIQHIPANVSLHFPPPVILFYGWSKKMLRADTAKIDWNPDKKQWHVTITIGSEVIKRWLKNHPHETADDSLRSLALETAKDEGYDLDANQVTVVR
jgi:hypothetical protein